MRGVFLRFPSDSKTKIRNQSCDTDIPLGRRIQFSTRDFWVLFTTVGASTTLLPVNLGIVAWQHGDMTAIIHRHFIVAVGECYRPTGIPE